MHNEEKVPKEYVSSFFEWFESQEGLGSLDQYCKKVYDAIPNPALFDNNPSDYCLDWQSPAYVFTFPNGYVFGENGVIITPDNKLVWDLSTEFISSPADHSLFKRNHLPKVESSSKTIGVIATLGGHNYYHWMFDILPRFDLLTKSRIPIDYYILNKCNFSYQRETLDLLRIPKEKIIQSSNDMFIQSKQLVVPSRTGYTAKWASDFLREKFLPFANDMTTSFSERIYITREDAEGRRVLNEEEVVNFLNEHGFTKVSLQNLSVVEQINLFSKAKFIVAPHGAGLTNLTFCNPGTKVIEFFSPNYLETCYWHLSSFLDLNYRHIIGEGIHYDQYPNDSTYWSGFDNIKIDIEQLKKAVNDLELE
ncbi:glycosyltransferase family 61 protein [Robertmurraya korlensis]|uniref:glycosyltransferase family 61 protein n=1 Tax=Robertmurraya korlensis TaxID=519977 RepID=UPI00203E9A5F|nr:glycosyltransferase family 61 protein [Robertmurraya korlensis]MCM3603610.1 glycosyltransferase family 61 protein [Robertmurraya korlensis]